MSKEMLSTSKEIPKHKNALEEKYKSLRLVNKEPKLWVRQRWQAYLKKVKRQLGKRGKYEQERDDSSS